MDGNRLSSASMEEMPYLQIASFANNHIKETSGISHPRLVNLNLKGGWLYIEDFFKFLLEEKLHTLLLLGK